ncbi:ROK family transcriptional regulator [Amycolatopsis antarctica]|uniref:ROK family transcriptional regulator n=1 Tax=Amycolatopsis antarctica TaxID=1854586 RepID=UPI001F0AF01C|nr:ROK family transcriptional regulator [Amycolatopsis antarctica]
MTAVLPERSAVPGGSREANAVAVLGTIRRHGPLSRAAIAAGAGLSLPTVSRVVTALTELRLVREQPDHVHDRGVGRPRVPIDVDTSAVAACGIHLGLSTTTVGLADLRGRLLESERMPTPAGSAEDALTSIAERVRALLRRHPARLVAGVGLAAGGLVDPDSGVLRHDGLGWPEVEAGTTLERALGLPVVVDGHVPAMAAAELLFGSGGRAGTMLYVYARQVTGAVLAVDGRVLRGRGRAGGIAHLPVGGDVRCGCGARGCLEVTVAERTVLAEALRAGVVDRPDIRSLHVAAADGHPDADRLLTGRARALGRAVAVLRDLHDPDVVVLGGQAVTDAPGHFPELRDSFAAASALPGTELLRQNSFGPDVQAVAACTGVLERVYAHPFGSR